MLLDPPSNKEWAKKWPGDFLLETIKDSKYTDDTETEIKKRLQTHLLPENLIDIKEDSGRELKRAYETFLNERAKMLDLRIDKLLKDGEISK